MKEKQLTRRILQYVAGLVCMAVGLVLLKRTYWGVSPITAVPDAVTNVTHISLGNTTILLHILCVVLQIIVQKRVTLKSILCAFVGVPFGKLVDLFMAFWNPTMVLWQKILSLVLGIAIQGFGVALISGCDLMLPAPDEFNNVVARTYNKKLGNVKMVADAVYVLVAIVINFIFQHTLPFLSADSSVGISSIASVLLTGRFVQMSFRVLPSIRMSPFFSVPKNESQ